MKSNKKKQLNKLRRGTMKKHFKGETSKHVSLTILVVSSSSLSG